MKVIDILNQKFGRWTVVKFLETRGKSGQSYWLCKCKCGTSKEVRASHLKSGQSTSCGCYSRERSSKQLKEYATSDKHRGSGNPQWKGDKATYPAFHSWLSLHYKKEKCEHCGVKNKRLDWALIKGKKYCHSRDNFIPLCRSYHLKYDYTEDRKQKLRK